MFYVGQKVVCVDVRGNHLLKLDAIYTIAGHKNFIDGDAGVLLVEVKHWNAATPFLPHRFRPVVERKTDISIFQKMLTPNKRVKESVK